MNVKKPVSLRLDEETLRKISELSKNEGVSRSILLNRAIVRFIKGYGATQPDASYASKKIIEIDGKYNNMVNQYNNMANQYTNLVNRVNILTRQVDILLKKVNDLARGDRNQANTGEDRKGQPVA